MCLSLDQRQRLSAVYDESQEIEQMLKEWDEDPDCAPDEDDWIFESMNDDERNRFYPGPAHVCASG